MVRGNDRRQCVDQTKPLVGARQKQNAAVGTDQAAVERGGDPLPADAWQGEWQKLIVVIGGHGRFCPDVETGVGTQALRDSSQVYHACQRIPAMR